MKSPNSKAFINQYKLDLNELKNKIPEYKSLYDLSEIIKALADPIRLEILYLLKNQELCACYIDSILNKPQSTIAHHLSILKKANILNWRKEGKWTYYSLSNSKIIGLIEEIAGEKTTNKSAYEKITDEDNTSKTEIKNRINDKFFKNFEKKAKDFNIFSIAYTKIETNNIINVENIINMNIINNNTNNEIVYENVIILAIEMDEGIINANSGKKAKNLNKKFYDKFRKITEELSQYLENSGINTEIVYPNEKLLDLTSLGQKAGLGYVGQSGLLITPEFGSKIKLSGILTSINDPIFDKSNNDHKWIKEQCKDCGECIESCESGALVIKDGDYTAELSNSKCIGSDEGCTVCIEKCPFNKKGYWIVKKELLEDSK